MSRFNQWELVGGPRDGDFVRCEGYEFRIPAPADCTAFIAPENIPLTPLTVGIYRAPDLLRVLLSDVSGVTPTMEWQGYTNG